MGMETFSKKVIVDTLMSSEDYTNQLERLLTSVTDAESQVRQSAFSAVQQVESTFATIEASLVDILRTRKETILHSIRFIEGESIVPLSLCKQSIIEKMLENNLFIDSTKQILRSGGFPSEKICHDFIDKSSLLGALPAVPDLEVVPNITFNVNSEDCLSKCKSVIEDIGKVYKIGPVQICFIEPHPGGLLVKWEEVDFENLVDIFSYRLQIAYCDRTTANSFGSGYNIFHDIYIGADREFLARDLRPNETYSFRVCCQFSSDSEWSPWSLVKSGVTTLPPYTWDKSNIHYTTSNEYKLATGMEISSPSVLYSSEALVTHGSSIQFTLLSFSTLNPMEGVGISASQHSGNSLQEIGIIYVTFVGDIYVDGKKKVMSFPKMKMNSKITLRCEKLQSKWRISIEIGNNGVTYEWPTTAERLFFASILLRDTKILVE